MTAVFLGQPGVGNLRGDHSFPAAARTALADEQLRRNIGHATGTIRAKRLAAVAECNCRNTLAIKVLGSFFYIFPFFMHQQVCPVTIHTACSRFRENMVGNTRHVIA